MRLKPLHPRVRAGRGDGKHERAQVSPVDGGLKGAEGRGWDVAEVAANRQHFPAATRLAPFDGQARMMENPGLRWLAGRWA
jgi:hypothetical protein